MPGANLGTTIRRPAVVNVGARHFSLQIMFVGDPQQIEFHEPVKWLQRRIAKFARNVCDAIDQIDAGDCPTIILLAMSWSGCFSPAEVDSLRRAAPLARIVALLGSWLEGESRTGRPLLGMPRVHWHQWSRLASEIEKLDRLERSVFSAPVTARDDERWSNPAELSASPRKVGIIARARESALALADICSQNAWNCQWIRDPSQIAPAEIDLILFDSRAGREDEFELISNLKSINSAIPIVVLQGFLRR